MDSTNTDNEETEKPQEKEVSPTVKLVEEANTPEAVARAIKDIVADSRLPKSERQFTEHNTTLRRLTYMERKLTDSYGKNRTH